MKEDDIEIKSYKLFKDTQDLLRNETNNLHSKMTSLGYEYCYEEGIDIDVIEEQKSKPKNANQSNLVLYFTDKNEPNEDILNKFLIEKYKANPNYPLFRKYFRQGNLKRLFK
jgi:hypothetical protein